MKNNTKFQDYPKSDQKAIIRGIVDRMRQAYGLDDNLALAELFGISIGTLKNWSVIMCIPKAYIFQCHCETGMSLNWLVQAIKPVSTYEATDEEISEMTTVICGDIEHAVNFRLISEKSKGGLNALTSALSKNVLDWVAANRIRD